MQAYILFYLSLSTLSLASVFFFRQCITTVYVSLGLAMLAVASWIWNLSEPVVTFSDFTVAYYPAGRAIVEDLSSLYKRCWNTPVCGFVNLPLIAFLFTPFSYVSLHQAQLLFTTVSVVLVLTGLYMLWSITDVHPARKWMMLCVFSLNGPLLYSLKEGNSTHIALFLLIAGIVCLDKKWEGRAGACFACAASLKPPLVLLGIYFLGRRRWSAVVGYGLTLAGISITSLWYAGWNSHLEWYREVILPFTNSGLSAFNVQSVEGLLLRFQRDAQLYEWKPVPIPSDIRMAAQAVATFLVGLSCTVFLRRSNKSDAETMYLELSMVLCVALVISPISWTHYYLLLLVPLALYMGRRLPVPEQGGWLAAMILSALLVTPPVIFLKSGSAIPSHLTTLLASHYVLGAVVLWAILGYARWQMANVPNHATHEVRPSSPKAIDRSLYPEDEPAQKAAGF